LKQPLEKGGIVTRFGILADDLTGAMDTGVGFAKMGLDTVLTFGGRLPRDTSVVVISTDSRSDDPETACRKVRRQARKFSGRYIYKKVDSTLRGNIGSELRAVMEELGIEKAVVSPAFPANKRTVANGKLLVAGIPVDRTAFAQDPVFPVTEAHIPTLLQKQSGLQVGSLGSDDVNRGPAHLNQLITTSQAKIIVADATEETHLRYIAEALAMTNCLWLPCGSAGLAMELPPAFGFSGSVSKVATPAVNQQPVLAVVSSRHEATLRQLKVAESSLKLPLISVQPDEFISPKGQFIKLNQIAKEIDRFLDCGRSIIITSALSRYVPALKVASARLLARIAFRTLQRWQLSGLFLSGGDVAREMCRALGATGIGILEELEPGVAVGELIGGTRNGLRIVTKAGGFGSDTVIADAIYYLEGRGRYS